MYKPSIRGLFAAWFMGMTLVGCATTSDGQDVLVIYDAAEASYRQGELSQAEAGYRQVVASKPDFYQPWLRLGNIYVRTEQYEAAVRMFEKCTELQPNDVRGWNNLALTRMKQGVGVLKRAQAHFPEDSKGYSVLQKTGIRFLGNAQ